MSYIEDIDFTKEDQGKSKHPETVGDLSYADLEERVFNAIDAKFRTLPRIKEHAGLERAFDLTPIIEGMELDKKIARHDNGTITAFFRYTQKPTRFWLTGDRTVDAEFDEAYVPSAPKETEAEVNRRMNAAQKGRAPIEISVAVLEDAAAKYSERKDIAEACGVGYSTLLAKMRTDRKLRDAFDRGRRIFSQNTYGQTATAVAQPEQNPESTSPVAKTSGVRNPNTSNAHIFARKPAPQTPEVDAKTLENAFAEHGKLADVAQALDIAASVLYDMIERSPILREACDDGRLKFKQRQRDVAAPGTEPITEPNEEKPMSRGKALQMDKTAVYQAARTEPNLIAVAKKAGDCGQAAFSRAISRDPELRQAYELGWAEYKLSQEKSAEKTPEFEGPIERFPSKTVRAPLDPEPAVIMETPQISELETSEVSEDVLEPVKHPTHIGMEIDPPEQLLQPQVKTVAISGAVLHIGFKGDLFAMPRRDRDLLNDIVDLVQKHEEASA